MENIQNEGLSLVNSITCVKPKATVFPVLIIESLDIVIVDYVKRFGYLLSCFDDLYPLLSHVSDATASLLINALEPLIMPEIDDLETKKKVQQYSCQIDQTRININVCKFLCYFKSMGESIDAESEVKNLFSLYESSSQISIFCSYF